MADQTATPAPSTVVVKDPPAIKSDGGKPKKASTGGQSAGGKKNAAGKKSGKRGAAGADGAAAGLSLAAHPRAAHSVARAKAWGGLVGFALGGYLSLSTHTLADAGLRALAAGVVCYVAVWAIAVFVWRRLIVAELSHARQEALAAELAKLTSNSVDPSSSTS